MGVICRSSLLDGRGSVDRLDAEYYSSEAISLERSLRAGGAHALSSLAKISDVRVADPRRRVGSSAKASFAYLEISNVDPRDGFALPQDVPLAEASPRARSKLFKNAVVLSSVRPARNAVFLADDDQAAAIGSTGFIVLEATTTSPEVLFASLKASSTVAQLARRGRASMYPVLHPPDVLDVIVPTLSPGRRARVERTVRQAQKDRRDYLIALNAARSESDGFFGKADPDALVRGLGSAQSRGLLKSSVFGAGRLDAEFHAAPFSDVQDRLRSLARCKTLGELCERADTGRTPASSEYQDDSSSSVGVMKVAALTNHGINWPALDFAPSHKFANHSDSQIDDGDVVLTSSAHSASHIARKIDVVRDIPIGLSGRVTFAGEVMRLRLRGNELFPPEYVASFLRNPLGGEQVRRCTRGITSHIYPRDVLTNVLVPEPSSAVAETIREQAAAAHAARWSYRKHVLEAISEVEDAVDRLRA